MKNESPRTNIQADGSGIEVQPHTLWQLQSAKSKDSWKPRLSEMLFTHPIIHSLIPSKKCIRIPQALL